MLQNNLDPEVAERPDDLVVYGGTGRAARSWDAFDAMLATLRTLGDDETMLVQSGKPVGVFRTHEWAPRVLPEPLIVNFVNTSLRDILTFIGNYTGINVTFDRDLQDRSGHGADGRRLARAGAPADHARRTACSIVSSTSAPSSSPPIRLRSGSSTKSR